MSTLSEIPKTYSDFTKKINLDSSSQFPWIEFGNKKFIILNEEHYKLFLKENKEQNIKYHIENNSNFYNKNNNNKKDDNFTYDLENNYDSEITNKIDDLIENFINKITSLKEQTKKDLEKKTDMFLKDIQKAIYNEKKIDDFIENQNFEKIKEYINVLPSPAKKTDIYFEKPEKKPEKCHYCQNDVVKIFVKCVKCNFFICQDCYQILSTTFFHQHPLVTERNELVTKSYDAVNENTPKELNVRSRDKIDKIEIKMKNTGTKNWINGQITLNLLDESKEKNKDLDFPSIDVAKKTKPNDIGIFKFDINYELLKKGTNEILMRLKHEEYGVYFGPTVKVTVVKSK
jgi:hypothetical protein